MAEVYLDPKNDIVFKRIFGEHAHILRSFLNAMLPLPADGQIVDLVYLPPEQAPVLPVLKNSIVDVKCSDAKGRQFIVEMQINWTSAFLQRVLFNASKAFVRQLDRGENYRLLQPVYGLSVLDDVFDKETDEFYHHYAMVNVVNPQRTIEGLELVFVELPKYAKAKTESMLPLKRAWIRFLREAGSQKSPEGLALFKSEVTSQAPELEEALELTRQAAFNKPQLEAYEAYWDAVSTERTLMDGKLAEGHEKGLEQGIEIGIEKGIGIGMEEGRRIEREAMRAKLGGRGLSKGEIDDLLGPAS